MTADEVGVTTKIGGGITAARPSEERVDGEPCQACTPLSVAEEVSGISSFGDKRRRRGSQSPCLWTHQFNGRVCGVEVIEVATSIAVLALVVPREELCHLRREGERGGLGEVNKGEAVEQACQAWELTLVGEVRPPHRVA